MLQTWLELKQIKLKQDKMPIDDTIELYQERALRFFHENEAFLVSYILRPFLFEFLFHTTNIAFIRQFVLAIMIINTFVYLFNHNVISGVNKFMFGPIVFTPFFIDDSILINLFLYALLSDNNPYIGLSQALLGLIATSRYNIFVSTLIIALATIIADSYKIVYYLNNNQRYLFYINWNQMRGYTLRSIVDNSNREARIFIEGIIERCLSNSNQ